MQIELAMLRAEVRTLADQLKDAENLASSQVRTFYSIRPLFTAHTAWCATPTPEAHDPVGPARTHV